MFGNILENIGRHAQLTVEERAAFCALTERRQVKKKEKLVQRGDVCRHEIYINKGCLRMFFTDREDVEHSFYFGIEDWWVSDLYSRSFKLPSEYEIVALEDSEVLMIADDDLEDFLLRVPKMERFYRKLLQHSLAMYERRLLQEHLLTAEERYKWFREKYPAFDNRIPQKYIASFLGITPEFFNTVRTKVLRQV